MAETTASTITATTSNILKRPCEDTLVDQALHKRLHTADEDENGAGQAILQTVDVIHADINEIVAQAEREKERITRESAEAVQKQLLQRAEVLQQVPGFWPAAFRQSCAKDYLTEDDDKLLEYLVAIDVLQDEEAGSFSFTLRFTDDNPYLETTEITRVVGSDPTIETTVTPVVWRAGQEFSPPTNDSGAGAFDTCNFFQRFTSTPQFEEVDNIMNNVFWDPLKYFRGTADLDAERQEWQLHQMELAVAGGLPEEEEASDDEDADAEGDGEGDADGEDDQIEVAQEEEEEEEEADEEDDDAL